MRNLNEYARKAMSMLDSIGVPYSVVDSFKVNNRAKSRWGSCAKQYGRYTIDINGELLNERNSEDGLINTLIHELIHTCPNCMNHGTEWKKWATLVYVMLGYDVKRCSSAEEKGVIEHTVTPVNYKYFFHCANCGMVFKNERECKFVRNYTHYRCSCGGKIISDN